MCLYPVHVRITKTLALKLSALMSIFSSVDMQGDLLIAMVFRRRVLLHDYIPAVPTAYVLANRASPKVSTDAVFSTRGTPHH